MPCLSVVGVPAPPAIPVEEPEPAPPPIPVEQPTDKSKKKDRKCPDCGDALRKFEGKWRCWTCGWPDHQTSGHTATQLGSKKEKRQPTAPKGAWLGSKQKKSNEKKTLFKIKRKNKIVKKNHKGK